MDILTDMYAQTDSFKLKKQIIYALSQQIKRERVVRQMIKMARTETNTEVKKQIIYWLSQSKSEEAMKFLKEILEK